MAKKKHPASEDEKNKFNAERQTYALAYTEKDILKFVYFLSFWRTEKYVSQFLYFEPLFASWKHSSRNRLLFLTRQKINEIVIELVNARVPKHKIKRFGRDEIDILSDHAALSLAFGFDFLFWLYSLTDFTHRFKHCNFAIYSIVLNVWNTSPSSNRMVE